MPNLEECRVLIVEDEILMAILHEDVLRDVGCRHLAVAASVDEAVDKVRAWQPHAAILDLNLQGEKSFPVADALDAAGVPFVIVSGHNRSILPAHHAGRPFLDKPYPPQLLLAALRQVLDNPDC
ncbi:response regulator [Vineibacter terrae]|uniref:Response regulator n=1 Tax=Vineibacter terrae TaxID=2586908 RepID=A0A5C8PW91_9HYPH|nr:response regulator [Vineibacter terrae]TXL82129.1 response regulator [Vineibacter terrae]